MYLCACVRDVMRTQRSSRAECVWQSVGQREGGRELGAERYWDAADAHHGDLIRKVNKKKSG